MKRLGIVGLIGIVVVAVVMGICGVGCDTVTDSSGAISFTTPLMTVTGRYAVVITVSDTNNNLYLPLIWSVSDSSLGDFTEQGGLTALYMGGTEVGINTITARDQGNAEGIMVVNHVPADGISLSPLTNTLDGAGAQMQFTVVPDGLALPLVWTSGNEAFGVFVGGGQYDAVYAAVGPVGDNFISVRDQMGASATAIVYHR